MRLGDEMSEFHHDDQESFVFTTRKAKDKDLISWTIVVHEECIGFADLLIQAEAECT